MKRLKKIVLLLSLVLVVFAVCGCAKSDDSILEEKKAALQVSMEAFALRLEALRGMSDDDLQANIDEIEAYKKSGQLTEETAKANVDVLKAWHNIEGVTGDFKQVKEFSFDPAGKTYTATLTLEYANRDVNLVYVVSKKDFAITGANVEIVYSLGEKMSKAGLNTLTGIGIVFIMLVLMSLIIWAFSIIPYIQNKIKGKKPDDTVIEVTTLSGLDEDNNENVDDQELIAVIAAAIAASTEMSTDDFVVRSIRRRA